MSLLFSLSVPHTPTDEKDDSSAEETKVAEAIPTFPFPVDPDDHCESPLEAYRDILPLLQFLARRLHGGTQQQLSIYDPYYCNGTVIRHLAELGFPSVYNRREDCYKVWAEYQLQQSSQTYSDNDNNNIVSSYDILLTNPPYSGDHIERLVQFVTTTNTDRPWFLLLPQWVHKKDYYIRATAATPPFYVIPRHRRYVYTPPPHYRAQKRSDVHKRSSPFMTMWYCCGGTQHDALLQMAARLLAPQCDVARTKSALRDVRRKRSREQQKR